jgi:two-component system, cell cycle sensor histidine kinase and response regulator CckA
MNPRRDSAPTALVVDDQEILARLMCKTLESDGFRVLAANNGAEALALCRGAEPPVDLLVTDYSMPGMTGFELAQEYCSFNCELSVLYVSGSWPGDDLRADLETARHVFLAKPFRQSDLLRSAKALLAMQPAVVLAAENHGVGR